MPEKNEPNYLGDVLKWEQDNMYSRENVTVKSGESLAVVEVVGRITKSTPTTGTAGEGNTGTGTMTGVAAGPDTQVGTYTATCIAVAANSGIFAVVAPDGAALPEATVAVAYANDQLNLTINDGATDYAVGDIFTVEVAAGSGQIVPVDASAVDGSQKAYGFMAGAVDATGGAKAGVAVVRDAIIVTTNLVWPDGASAGEKAAWLADLADAGIVTRSGASGPLPSAVPA